MFLIDGEASGRISCELSNWTGKAYKIPRNMIKASKDRPDLNGTGVYFLFGKDDEQNDLVYIGEAEDVLKRINDHLKNKDFWTEVIILISKDDNLNKAHIKYLEHYFYKESQKVNRYKLTNENIPVLSSISESDQAEMEEFMLNSMLLIGTLGHKIFENKIDNTSTESNDEIFYIRAARGADASMVRSPEGFVVRKESKFANPVVGSFQPSFKKVRESLIERGLLSFDEHDALVLKENYIFTSPSTAAALVMGRSANGLIEWKLLNGKSLKDVESIND